MSNPEDFGIPPLKIEEQSGPFPLEKFTRKPSRAYQEAPSAAQAGRMPPQAVDTEKAVLGAALIAPEAVPRAIELLRPEAFYDQRHQHIFQAIVDLFERNNPVDLVTITEELRRKGILEEIGGPYYLTELTSSVASAANVEYHARIIAEKYLLRRLIATMTRLAGMAYDTGADAFELLDRAEQEIFRISESELRKPAFSLKEVVKQTIRRMEALQGREGLTGVPSGFHALDALTGGWQPSDLIIVAARPSMGKTAFALSLARNAALHREYGTGVAIFSLEMSAEQLAQRLLTSEARVSAQLARTGRLKEEDWRKLAFAAGRLSEASIFIDDTPSIGVLELRAKCRRLKAEHDIGLILVDYLQLMQGGKDARNREQEIAHISRSLKALAKELNVPVIALSQLSRAVETRGGDKRPQLSDLRESGSIEQDADVVLFIYRAERYGILTDEQGHSTEGIAEIIVGKQRNGPIGSIKLAFVKEYARFENLTTYTVPEMESGDMPPPPLEPGF